MEQLNVSGAKSPKRPPSPPLAARIRVAVRVRPPTISESDDPTPLCVTEPDPTNVSENMLQFQLEKTQKTFRFDHVFSAEAQQADVYHLSLQPLLASLLHGFNVTVLAYGQTGSGKTYTMGGTGSGDGLISRFLRDLFGTLRSEESSKTTAKASFLEIYCDEIRDLLVDEPARNNNAQNNIRAKLAIHEDDHDVWVEGLEKVTVKRVDEALNLLKAGRQRQTIGAHALNDSSSRSHAVFTLEISRVFANEIKSAKLTFVDLAGSERVKKTLMDGQGMKEGSHINIGLLALGNVINALGSRQRTLQRRNGPVVSGRSSSAGANDTTLASGSAHVPYRSSKLTRLLRDALGGNSVTLFIACISPETTNGNETLCTLQYANRARSIQNKAQKNVEEAASADIMDDEAVFQYATESEREIKDLRAQVAALKLQLGQAVAAAKTVEVSDFSHVEGFQIETTLSDSNQANVVAPKTLKSSETRRPLRIAPLELDMTDMANFEDNNQSLESKQREGTVNPKTRQLRQGNFFIDSTLSDPTDQTESEEGKPQPKNIVSHATPSKVVPTTRNKDVIATRTGNHVRDMSTQYEFPMCLQNERKTPVDYVLLSPSQIFREVHHQRQKAMAGAPSPWPHQRRLDTPQRERRYSPSALLTLDTNNNTPSNTSDTYSNTLDVLQDLLQRTQQLVDSPERWEPDSKPEVDDQEQKQEQQSPLSLSAFVGRMTALFDQRNRQQQFVHRLTQRYRHLATLLGVEAIDYQMSELSKYTLERQQAALLQHLETFELLAAERLWIRLQHRKVAIENYAGVWNDKLEDMFLTDDQNEACTRWHSHRDDHEFFRRHILPFILTDYISVTPEVLDNEQLWLTL